jgi:hypothetical protein
MSSLLSERCKTIGNFPIVSTAEFKTCCSIPLSMLNGIKVPKEYVSGDEKPALYGDLWKILTLNNIIYFILEISVTKEQFYTSIKESFNKIKNHTCNVKNQSFFVTPWSKKIVGVSEKNIISKIPELLIKSGFDYMGKYLTTEADLGTHTLAVPYEQNAKIDISPKNEAPSVINYLGEDDIEWDHVYMGKGGYTGGNVFVGRTYTPSPPPIKTYQFMKIYCGEKSSLEISNVEKEKVLETKEIIHLLYGIDK